LFSEKHKREATMSRISPLTLKGIGYVISTISVVLLAIVSWRHASNDLLLAVCLVGGVATSIAGMCFRWASYVLEKWQKVT
jgi:hypothetical protein